MNTSTTLLILLLSALLEAGGDAVIRVGIHSNHSQAMRIGLMAAGALILFGYGCLVNASKWDFGQLLGIYVVFFFVIAQLIGWAAFHQVPSPRILLGGGFIVIGGLIVSSASRF